MGGVLSLPLGEGCEAASWCAVALVDAPRPSERGGKRASAAVVPIEMPDRVGFNQLDNAGRGKQCIGLPAIANLGRLE